MFKQDNDSRDVAIMTVSSSGILHFLNDKHDTRLHVLKFQTPAEFVDCILSVSSSSASHKHTDDDDNNCTLTTHCVGGKRQEICVLVANVFEATELLKALKKSSTPSTDQFVMFGSNLVRVAVWGLEGADYSGTIVVVSPSLADFLSPILAAEAAMTVQRKTIMFQELRLTLQIG